jgi:hypothetical protein
MASKKTPRKGAIVPATRVPASGPPPADAYDALVTSMYLLNIRFARASVTAENIFVAQKGRKLEPKVDTGASFVNFGSGIAITATLDFRGQYTDEEDPAISAEAELELLFRSAIPMTDDLFELYQVRNLSVFTWPYFREFLHSAIARTGWPVYTLPPFHWDRARDEGARLPATLEGFSE